MPDKRAELSASRKDIANYLGLTRWRPPCPTRIARTLVMRPQPRVTHRQYTKK
jgi:hypothetical protein